MTHLFISVSFYYALGAVIFSQSKHEWRDIALAGVFALLAIACRPTGKDD